MENKKKYLQSLIDDLEKNIQENFGDIDRQQQQLEIYQDQLNILNLSPEKQIEKGYYPHGTWHGYKHVDGKLKVKPIICEIDRNSPFVQEYISPFFVDDNSPEKALEIARIKLKEVKDDR